MQYGLIGETLKHSYSKPIQEKLLQPYTYEIHPIASSDLDAFMKDKTFQGINVTIPYKEKVIPYLDQIDDHAKQIGAVNTIVNQNGKLIGYNSDYYGFDYTLKHHHIDVSNKKVLVLGNGGGSKAVKAVLLDHHAKTIITTARTLKEGVTSLEDVYKYHHDAQIIVNTTPVGMYPHVDERVIDLSKFTNLSACIDIIYNPHTTQFLLDAQAKNILAVNGLEMLVAQAKKALELFKDMTIDDQRMDEVYHEILQETLNIATINHDDKQIELLSKLTNKQVVHYTKPRDAILSNTILVINKLDEQTKTELKRNSIFITEKEANAMIKQFQTQIHMI